MGDPAGGESSDLGRVLIEGTLHKKNERTDDKHKAHHRTWHVFHVKLIGDTLHFYTSNSGDSSDDDDETPKERAAAAKKNEKQHKKSVSNVQNGDFDETARIIKSPSQSTDNLEALARDNYLLGTISVEGATCEEAHDYKKRPFVFRLITRRKAEYLFQAGSIAEMASWIQHIASVAGDARPASPPEAAAHGEKPARTKEEKAALRKSTSSIPASSAQQPGQQQAQPDDAETGDKKKGGFFGAFKKSRTSTHHHKAPADGKGSHHAPVFGGPLEEQQLDSEYGIPLIVAKCIDLLDAKALSSVGLYRLAGNSVSITSLKAAFNTAADKVDLTDVKTYDDDYNVIADCLKSFFRELPVPLIPFDHYADFIQAGKVIRYEDRMYEIQRLVHGLPAVNFATLRFLMGHLARVAAQSEVNKMAAANLAIVFGQNLMRSPTETMQMIIGDMPFKCTVVEALISQPTWVFDEYVAPAAEATDDVIPVVTSSDDEPAEAAAAAAAATSEDEPAADESYTASSASAFLSAESGQGFARRSMECPPERRSVFYDDRGYETTPSPAVYEAIQEEEEERQRSLDEQRASMHEEGGEHHHHEEQYDEGQHQHYEEAGEQQDEAQPLQAEEEEA